MKNVLLCLIFIFTFSITHSHAAAAAERLLDPLSDADMHATQGSSPYHSYRVREMFPKMHQKGDEMSDGDLQFIFLFGIYQHYVHQFTGLDAEYNYFMLAENPKDARAYDMMKFTSLLECKGEDIKALTRDELISKAISYGRWIQCTLEELRKNSLFAILGGDFQRDKVIAEKKEAALATEDGEKKEAVYKELMAADRRAIDRQTLLFHWTKDVFETSKARFDFFNKAPIKPGEDEFIKSLAKSYRPDFLSWERYAPLLRG